MPSPVAQRTIDETYRDLRDKAMAALADESETVTIEGPTAAVAFLFRVSPKMIIDLLDELSALREASEWVEISKGGLPSDDVNVIVASEDWNVVTGAMCIEGEWFDRTGYAWRERYSKDPYRWRPTGAPPQPASAGKEPK